MSTEAGQLKESRTITGRVYLRLVEAANILLAHRPVWTEWLLLRLVRVLYSRRLRRLVAVLLSDLTAEILAASERMAGPMGRVTQN